MDRHNRNYKLIDNPSALNKKTSYKDTKYPQPHNYPPLGKTQAKKRVAWRDASIVVGTWALFAAAIVTVKPSEIEKASTPWRLGLTRQFQVIGFIMGIMNNMFLAVVPKFFYLLEYHFGPSYLQNYDAILRNSFLQPGTNLLWRVGLILNTILPLALGIAYKEFDHGIGRHTLIQSNESFYGLTAPADIDSVGFVGLSIMANTTLPFYDATLNDPPIPNSPTAYGYNTLLLSNYSSAKLDCPIPAYVQNIQGSLKPNEAYILDANVFATVTTYNKSIESNRNNFDFWNYYIGMMGNRSVNTPNNPNDSPIPTGNQSFLARRLSVHNLFNSKTLVLLMNDLDVLNSSWIFAALINTQYPILSDTFIDSFRASALLFQTRRENCTGQWRITYNSIQLLNGACNSPPLPSADQVLFTNTTLALLSWYSPMLVEYLGPFSAARNQSSWLIPTASTVVSGMYWSRVTQLNGYHGLGSNNTPVNNAAPGVTPLAIKAYYHVNDNVVSERVVMNTPAYLYIILCIPPVLTTLAFLACVLMYRAPLDNGFGMIAVLAGVRPASLMLLNGASLSGVLRERVRVGITRARWKEGNRAVVYGLERTRVLPFEDRLWAVCKWLFGWGGRKRYRELR